LVTHNSDKHRFEITEEGETGELVYRLSPGKISFTHTGVPVKVRKRGIAGQLVAAGLSYAREQGLKVVPVCPYVSWYLQQHPEYQDLVER
jgi:predicted GNAT family acetyltransferase